MDTAPPLADTPIVSMDHISKRFGQTEANTAVCMEISSGSIHALVGENGAGKSTLMHILSGAMRPDEGEIRVAGSPVSFSNPREAMDVGIGMVHQHPPLFDSMTVIQNMAIVSPGYRRYARRFALRSYVEREFANYGIVINLDAKVATLSDAEKQFVSFVSLKYLPLRVLILDEPTATFTKHDEMRYYRMVLDARQQNRSIVLITHKIREVSDIADTMTVMRKGHSVYTGDVGHKSNNEIRTLLFGNSSESGVEMTRPDVQNNSAALRLRGITFTEGGANRLSNINLAVRNGEIVVVTGIREFGPQQLEQICLGMIPPSSGTIELGVESYQSLTPTILRRRRVGIVPIDRNRTAVSGASKLWENLLLNRRNEIHPHGFLNTRRVKNRAETLIRKAGLTTGKDSSVSILSGGMLQRIIFAREFDTTRELLILSEPFRGLDVQSKERTIQILSTATQSGVGVLCFISDIDDVLSVADSIIVLRNGSVVARYTRETTTPQISRAAIENAVLGLEPSID